MTENKEQENNESKSEIPTQSNNLIDMLLSKSPGQVLDSETMILETQKRVWGALKKGYEYSGSSR